MKRGRSRIVIFVCVGIIAVAGTLWISERLTVRELRIAAGPRVGYSYQLGEALAQVVSAVEPRIRLVVKETKGSQENMDDIKSGRADLVIAPMHMGVGVNIRTVARLYPELYHLAVRAKSGIRSPGDLRGKRVLVPPKNTGSYHDFYLLAQHYGLGENDMAVNVIKSLEWKKDIERSLREQKIDAVFASVPLGEPMVCMLMRAGAWQLVPIDQAAAMKVMMPFIVPCAIPRGTYRAAGPAVPDCDMQTVGDQTSLFARAEVDDWLVFTITRILFEHQNELITHTPVAVSISAPDKAEVMGPALHKGARAYYNRGQPDIIKKYYNEICFFFMLGPMFLSIIMAMRARLQVKRARRIDEYTREISKLFLQIESATELKGLHDLERRLLKLFSQSLQDLDEGKLSLGDLQSLSLIWDKAVDAVHHRQIVWMSKA